MVESGDLKDYYKALITNDDADPNELADLFLAIVRISLESVWKDPEKAADLLYTIQYFTNELLEHFDNAHAIRILAEKAKNFDIDENYQELAISYIDQNDLKALQKEILKDVDKVKQDSNMMKQQLEAAMTTIQAELPKKNEQVIYIIK